MNGILPTEPQSVATVNPDPLRARICLCGPEGTGKTTLAAAWAPKTTLFVDLQHGTDLLPGDHFVQHVHSWTDFENTINAIVAPGQDRFRTIVIDTVDWGKGYGEAEGLFRRSISKLLARRDLGVWFIGHAELVEVKKRQVWMPKLDKRVREYITGDCEHVFFTEPIGNRIVLHTKASPAYNAKSRLSQFLPEPLDMDAVGLWHALNDGLKQLRGGQQPDNRQDPPGGEGDGRAQRPAGSDDDSPSAAHVKDPAVEGKAAEIREPEAVAA